MNNRPASGFRLGTLLLSTLFLCAAPAQASFSWLGGGADDFWTTADNWSGSFDPGSPAYWVASPPSDSYPGESAAALLADPGSYVSFELSDFGPNPHSETYTDLAEYQSAYDSHFGSLPDPVIYNASSFGPDPAGYSTLAEYRSAFPESTYTSNFTAAQSTVVTNISDIIVPSLSFGSAGSTAVDFNSDIKISSIAFNPDALGTLRTVQFNLAGSNLSGDFGTTQLGHQTLVFDSGVYTITNAFRVGSGDVGDVTTVRLQNGVVVNINDGNHFLGDSGTSAFEVVGGSELTNTSTMDIGRGSNTTASLTVSGVGSRVDNQGVGNATGNNSIGQSGGSGQLIVEDGGWFSGGRRIYVGNGSNGELIVRGSGLGAQDEVVYSTVTTTSAHSGLVLRGHRTGPSATGTAHALFQDGGQGVFAHGLTVFNGGVLEIDRGFVTVTTGTLGVVSVDGVDRSRYLDAGSELIYWLYSGEYDPGIDISGDFEINDATLTVKLGDGFSAGLGEEFYLIKRPTTFIGTFDELVEGATLMIDGYQFEIGYAMGDDSDMIGLTVIPEPGVAAAIAAAIAALVVIRRRRR